MKVSVVIPNWNGQNLLAKNLPAVLNLKPDEVIVVDNGSEDDSVTFLRKNYPQIKLVVHQTNLGFALGCNSGVAVAKGEVVALLNSDVVPEKDCLRYSLDHFQEPAVFAVSFNEPQWSWAKIFWQRGLLEHQPGEKTEKTHLTGWASGGSSLFRKSVWDKLGGFDSLYEPFYWEDIDLSYRAWKRGYQVLWEPKAVVCHEHQATIGQHFSKEYIDFVNRRNQLLFVWKNITDTSLKYEHRLWLTWQLKNPAYWKVFLAACRRWPQAHLGNVKESQEVKVSDRELLKCFSQSSL